MAQEEATMINEIPRNVSCTAETLAAVIAQYGGVLRRGAHPAEDACCVLEAYSVCLGVPWTDDPVILGMPDIRPLNDARWSSDEVMTTAMIRLAMAYIGWSRWSVGRQRAVMSQVALETVRHLIAELPGLPADLRRQCQTAETLYDAADAARAVARAAGAADVARADAAWAARAAAVAADAARAAAVAARAAARAAAEAAAVVRGERLPDWDAPDHAADHILQTAVQLWIDATT
jgi:hypothetical protein